MSLWVAVQDMRGDVRPEFAECVGGSVAQEGIPELGADGAGSAGLAGVIREGDGLRQATPQHLGGIECIVPFIVGSDEDARSGVGEALPDVAAVAHGVIAFVLVKGDR